MSKKKPSQPKEELITKDERLMRVQGDDELERAKAFWQNNKTGIIGGIALGIAIVVGYNFWQSYQLKSGLAASSSYQQLVQADDLQTQNELTQKALSEHGDTVYSAMSVLHTAKSFVDDGDYVAAEGLLQDALSKTDDVAMVNLLQQRLAQILLQQQKYDEVIALLTGKQPSGYASYYFELIGDAQIAKGEIAKAQAAYEKALENVGAQASRSSMLELKLQNLK